VLLAGQDGDVARLCMLSSVGLSCASTVPEHQPSFASLSPVRGVIVPVNREPKSAATCGVSPRQASVFVDHQEGDIPHS